MLRPRALNQKGFSLIELMVAAAVLGVIVVVVFEALPNLGIINKQSKNITIATQAAQRQIELYRNTPYASIPVGTTDITSTLSSYPSLRTPRSASAVVSEVHTNALKSVTVSVSFTEAGRSRQVKLTTQIAARGINR